MVNDAGVGNCQRIAHHPPVDRYRSAHQPLCLCRDGKEEMGGEVLTIVWLDRPPTGFTDVHFLPTTGSSVRAVRPSAWLALVLLPSLGARGGTCPRGLSSLDC